VSHFLSLARGSEYSVDGANRPIELSREQNAAVRIAAIAEPSMKNPHALHGKKPVAYTWNGAIFPTAVPSTFIQLWFSY
jgi:hypothetical protein